MQYGQAITITGTATDTGGGVVGAVEVSVDGGQTWHPAVGREQWSYSGWVPSSLTGSVTIQTRAVDDSANLQSTPTSASLTVTGGPNCPCSIWSNTTTPGTASANDGSAVEVGVKFRSDAAGLVTGMRFYKGTANTGTHVGNLWTASGTKLATVTFTNETASGWQQANFAQPVSISANTTYVISYFAPVGRYADDTGYFGGKGVDNPPLHALADGVDGGDGVYVYSSASSFPNNTFSSENYWVDVVFVLPGTRSITGTISGGAGAR